MYRIQIPTHHHARVPVLDRPKSCSSRQQQRQEIPLGRTPRELQRLANKPQHLRKQRNAFRPRCGFQVFLIKGTRQKAGRKIWRKKGYEETKTTFIRAAGTES